MSAFFILFDFKLENSSLLKKKVKCERSQTGLEIKDLMKIAFSEFNLLNNYAVKRILINDVDFENELVDLPDVDIFAENLKVFVELCLVIIN
jgi:hypothetical protein